ncbi:MAG TPA: ribonuclease III [Candidatus Colwellbacteria bacterium]|nr:ribonuclease III [Candidatus Colwellbacteria bacterium]HQA95851.1 ribonuclease III [Candidatus Colwellbacteria bacterium]
MDIISLENKIGVFFKNENILKEALTHRSYLNENPSWKLPHNERLEFLGDAVLELVSTEYLWRVRPKFEEGLLTLLRAALVNTKMLSKIAEEEIGLQKYLLVSKGESQMSGRAMETILADAFEALTGAIYVDQGFEAAKEFVSRFVLSRLEEIEKGQLYKDPKSLLQEISQADFKVTPEYRILSESGPDHARIFTVGVYFGNELKGEGSGASKQEAETDAAKKALEKLEAGK